MISIKVDVARCLRSLDDMALRQIPYATALALTRTAQDAQLEVRRELPQRFVLRNNFVSGGIRITPAKKDTLFAEVYSRDDFMALQEQGGAKKPMHGRHIAVPLDVKRNKRDIITRANRPRQILDKKRVFKLTLRDGRQAIAMRAGKKRDTVKILYILEDNVRIPARFGFGQTVLNVVRERFGRQFALAFRQAMATARR